MVSFDYPNRIYAYTHCIPDDYGNSKREMLYLVIQSTYKDSHIARLCRMSNAEVSRCMIVNKRLLLSISVGIMSDIHLPLLIFDTNIRICEIPIGQE